MTPSVTINGVPVYVQTAAKLLVLFAVHAMKPSTHLAFPAVEHDHCRTKVVRMLDYYDG